MGHLRRGRFARTSLRRSAGAGRSGARPGPRRASTLPAFQCDPIADQVADKVSALYELHGDAGTPSSRYRDLVDLILIIRSRALDAEVLASALRARQQHTRNRVELPRAMRVPGVGWAAGYRAEAGRSSLEPEIHDLEVALEHVGHCLNPVLSADIDHGTWSPAEHRWVP